MGLPRPAPGRGDRRRPPSVAATRRSRGRARCIARSSRPWGRPSERRRRNVGLRGRWVSCAWSRAWRRALNRRSSRTHRRRCRPRRAMNPGRARSVRDAGCRSGLRSASNAAWRGLEPCVDRPGRPGRSGQCRWLFTSVPRSVMALIAFDASPIPATLRPLVAIAASRAGAAEHHGLAQRSGSPPRRRRCDARWPPRERAARRARSRRRSRIRPVHSPRPSWHSRPYWRLPAGVWRTSDGALGATNERNQQALAGRPAGVSA